VLDNKKKHNEEAEAIKQKETGTENEQE